MTWKKKTAAEINARIFSSLEDTLNYTDELILGLPASQLDEKVFSREAGFVRNAPYLSTFVQNPNHIGCHTLGDSEHYFSGTQEIEREVLAICAEDILKAAPGSYDGYIAAGGTEANLQAIWIYRNYFQRTRSADLGEIAVLCSEDSHYSMAKAANMFQVCWSPVPVDPMKRTVAAAALNERLVELKESGVKYVIVVANMMTTMFGSVDNSFVYTHALRTQGLEFVVHVDAAYGGFYYPIVHEDQQLSFLNPDITSFTLDAHKMLQAPYGTGIFLVRKGWMDFASTPEASYVQGADCTISGSRSGANAVAVWMILASYGAHSWFEKMLILQKRADWLVARLCENGIRYFREAYSNIVAIAADDMEPSIAEQFGLVPDNHQAPSWYKIVIMEHVTIEKLENFLNAKLKMNA